MLPPVVITHPAGRFKLDRLKSGTYQMMVAVFGGGEASLPLKLDPGQRRHDLRIVAKPAVSVTGLVVGLESGTPLDGAHLFAISPGRRTVAATDQAGRFKIGGFSSDSTIRLSVSRYGHTGEQFDLHVPEAARDSHDLGTIRLTSKGGAPNVPGLSGTPGFFPEVREGRLVAGRVEPNSSAAESGIKSDDRLLTIDGRNVTEMGSGAAWSLLSGKTGTEVRVTLESPAGEPRTVTLVRKTPR